MTGTDHPAVRLKSPADLLVAVPYLLGFHPERSLVLVGFAGTRVTVTARVDLAGLGDSVAVFDALDAMHRGGANVVVGTIFGDHLAGLDSVATQITAAADLLGLDVLDTLVIAGGRWRSLSCENESCCPPDGRPLPEGPTAVDAAAVHAGLVARPDRQALAAVFEPPRDRPDLEECLLRHQETQLEAALRGGLASYERSAVRALFAAHRLAETGRMPTGDEVARFGVALQSFQVRDAAWMACDNGRLIGRELWVNLARRLPHPYDAPALFLAAWHAFREGNGALANIAAERALVADPSYSAADLLLAALARGVDPHALPRLRTSGDRDPAS